MAGIYIHIPFCKSKCIYCDFYSKTETSQIQSFVNSACKEIEIRKNYISTRNIETIYFGGGTPSFLQIDDLKQIIDKIYQIFDVSENCEITLEANPDDLNLEFIQELKTTKINRISLGIQSFNDDELLFLNRRHNAENAILAVRNLQKNAFKNISVDLIYGLPNSTIETWKKSIETAISLNIQHISAYHLTYEKGTKLYKLLNSKTISTIDEELSLEQFKLLINLLKNNNFEHYEISNFAKKDFHSKHNSSYWKQVEYLGIGPSAHSYNKISRQWNVSNISKYISGIEIENLDFEIEYLSTQDNYNDYIITSLRTSAGCDLNFIKNNFEPKFIQHFEKNIEQFLKLNLVQKTKSTFRLTEKGIFISDRIFGDLIFV